MGRGGGGIAEDIVSSGGSLSRRVRETESAPADRVLVGFAEVLEGSLPMSLGGSSGSNNTSLAAKRLLKDHVVGRPRPVWRGFEQRITDHLEREGRTDEDE